MLSYKTILIELTRSKFYFSASLLTTKKLKLLFQIYRLKYSVGYTKSLFQCKKQSSKLNEVIILLV